MRGKIQALAGTAVTNCGANWCESKPLTKYASLGAEMVGVENA